MTPRVSVVMSVFNGAAHLGATLDSILGQTLREIEVIVVDDGSTDATGAVLRNAAHRDPRLRTITVENGGLTRALIRGCTEARAPLIARHDCDDFSDPRRLELQAAAFNASPDLVFVSSWTAFVGPELEPLYVARGVSTGGRPADIIDPSDAWGVRGGPTSHPSVTFRRDAYERAGGYRAEWYYGQDWDLWYRLAERGKFLMIDRLLYTARVTTGSISGSAKRRQEAIGKLSREAFLARQRGESDAKIVARAAAIRPSPGDRKDPSSGLYFIGEALRRNGDPRARDYFRRAIAARPLLPRAWIRWVQTLRSGGEGRS
jgi:glycosyltransferase involved in cell wall biosynthesis